MPGNPIDQNAGLQYNIGDIIRQNIGASFIVDYGIVTTVNSDKTVNVVHAVMMEYINGDAAPTTNTNNVEVLFPASASFGQTWPIAVGDGVLLVGLKNIVPSTSGITGPTSTISEYAHYVQDTMKAIPLQTVANPTFQFNVDETGLAQIKNQSKSLFTILDNVDAAIQTFSSATSQSALTAASATSASLATALNLLLNTMNVSITAAKSDLALLLKA